MRGMQVVDVLDKHYVRITRVVDQGMLDLETFCPNFQGNGTYASINDQLPNSNNTDTDGDGANSVDVDASSILALVRQVTFEADVRKALAKVNEFMNYEVASTRVGLERTDAVTNQIDSLIEVVLGHDWLVRMFVLVTSVLCLSLLTAVLLARQNIVCYPFKSMLVWLLVPAFAVVTIIAALTSSMFAAAGVFNSDFCSGGPAPGSPEGTIESIIVQQGIQPTDLVYRSFVYYMEVRL